MLTNVDIAESLRGQALIRARGYLAKSVHPLLVDEAIMEGWIVWKKNKRTVALRRPKPHGMLLEDRVWYLLYRMGFTYLSKQGGAFLGVDPKQPTGPMNQIDILGIDDETALAIECKSSDTFKKRPEFQEELGKHALIRERFGNATRQQYPTPIRRQLALAMFTSNIDLSENDKKRAEEANIVLFNERDLKYYETLVSHLGPAARYQFLADLLPGKVIPGLSIKIPAIRSKIGRYTCYTFAIAPEYLLKIAYVSHRSKGDPSDVSTYQRMISKSRLNKIRSYLNDNGIFPTNIVVDLEKQPAFDKMQQETNQDGTIMGWLNLRAAYKSAWIIDGQHRLYAYSGHPKAEKARLSVLAFEKLPGSTQADLFININHEQKSVKQSLLQELYANLHWNAKNPEDRISAIVSRVVQSLGADNTSPFFHRILTADDKKDETRCISFNSIFHALDKPDFFITTIKKGEVLEFGPLWAGDNSDATEERARRVLNSWFRIIRDASPEWWNAGSGEGGGIAMNDGVTVCINVLRSVFQHLDASGEKLVKLDDEDLIARIRKYAVALAEYLSSLTYEERRIFREGRGVQGQTKNTRRCQLGMNGRVPSFNPHGLDIFIETERAETNTRAWAIVEHVEKVLQEIVVEMLQKAYDADDMQWWFRGVPKSIRVKVTQRQQEDDNSRGGVERYFDLIDYRDIVSQQWQLFGPILGYGKANVSKDKRTAWIVDVNEARKIVAHASSGRSVSLEELSQLQEYNKWLDEQVAKHQDDDVSANLGLQSA